MRVLEFSAGHHRLRYGFGEGDGLVRGLITIISRG